MGEADDNDNGNGDDSGIPQPDATSYSKAGFEVPGPENDGGLVACMNCNEVVDIFDAAVTADEVEHIERDDGTEVILSVKRRYVCSNECVLGGMFSELGVVE